jgi:crossover junction endodeoxyribonuclease RuvC
VNILAIDIGTTTGWALGARDGSIRSGSQSFAAGRLDGPGARWLKFRAFLTETGRSAGEIHAVYYEDVKNHVGVLAAHAYGGFQAHLQYWCEINRIPCTPLGVGQIKKHWTGRGNAKTGAS